jgi:hypothetical protein
MDDAPDVVETTTDICVGNEADCICAQTGSRVVAKAERPHVSQNAAVLTVTAETTLTPSTPLIVATRVEFERPFYLTDSFYNLSPKRGPPLS